LSGITAFVTARLDEDERTAKAAARPGGEDWHADPDPDAWGALAGTGVLRADGNGVAMAIGSYAADHIARHDPARVLREAAALREIAAGHRLVLADRGYPEQGQSQGSGREYRVTRDNPAEEQAGMANAMHWNKDCFSCHSRYPCRTIRHLAAIWSDHPDYDQGWAVS
jgi:hypothetical protein